MPCSSFEIHYEPAKVRLALVGEDGARALSGVVAQRNQSPRVGGTGTLRYIVLEPMHSRSGRIGPMGVIVGAAGAEAVHHHDDCEVSFGGVSGIAARSPGSVWAARSVASTVARAACWLGDEFVNSIPLS